MNSQTGVIAVKGDKLQYVAEGTGVPCIVVGPSLINRRLFAKELREQFQQAQEENSTRDRNDKGTGLAMNEAGGIGPDNR